MAAPAPATELKLAPADGLEKQLAGLLNIDVAATTDESTALTTANTIDGLFRQALKVNKDGAEDFLYTFWDVTLKTAVTVPATDPRMQHLVAIVESLKKKNTAEVEIWGNKTSVWKDLPLLGPALREAWNTKPELDGKEDHAELQKWVSLNSFAARILGKQLQSSFHLALWELRAALEEKHASEAARDLHLKTASEWIWHAGGELHRLSQEHVKTALPEDQLKITGTGGLVTTETKGPSKERWAFWKQRFGELSQELSHAAKEEGLKERVDGVVSVMDLIEQDAAKQTK